jgi:hypothetical protein
MAHTRNPSYPQPEPQQVVATPDITTGREEEGYLVLRPLVGVLVMRMVDYVWRGKGM